MTKLIISVSQHAVFEAESAISGCIACSPLALVRFDHVLDRLRDYEAGEAEYILCIFGRCPMCGSSLSEHTLVEFD